MLQPRDVVVVGGGVIGCAIAWRLAQAGLSVTLLERGRPGRGATWAAAGMLSPLGEIKHPDFLHLAAASRDLYDDFVAEVRAASGVHFEFGAPGKLEVAFDEADLKHLAEKHPPLLHKLTVLSLEKSISHDVIGGVLYPRDAFVDNRALGSALHTAALRAGVRVRTDATVLGIASKGGEVESVVLDNGERFACANVVLSAGAWSGQLKGLPRSLPVVPVKGQMVALRSAVKLRHMLESPRCYLIPRSAGRVLVGATVERVGFDAEITEAGIESMINAGRELVPELAHAELLEKWAGFRPGTPDNLPILGTEPLLRGLVYATGHFRNGILLAPITARLITDLITTSAPVLPLDAFSAQRFRDE